MMDEGRCVMDDKTLDEIEARTNAATAGPWRAEYKKGGDDTFGEEQYIVAPPQKALDFPGTVIVGTSYYDGINLLLREEDAEFIANARQDVPALVAALRDALGLVKRWASYALDIENALREVRAELDRYKDRERHFAEALAVADGGQYRNDWDGAIKRLIADRDGARAQRNRLHIALASLWQYLNAYVGDWYLKAERRAHALRVDDALRSVEAVTCTPEGSHHMACDCREAAHAAEVERLTRERDEAHARIRTLEHALCAARSHHEGCPCAEDREPYDPLVADPRCNCRAYLVNVRIDTALRPSGDGGGR